MTRNNSGQTKGCALVTGGSRGIGLALAKVLASHKYDLVLVARESDALEAAAGSIEGQYGVRALVMPSDLSLREAPRELFDRVRNQSVDIEILINNAGFGLGGEFLETDLDREMDMIEVNIAAVTQLTKLFGGAMVKRRHGRIMNVASTAAFQPGPLMSVYYATKAYVLSFSQAIAEELRNTGVTVTALCPGATATDFANTAEISNTRLFRRLGVADAESIAEYGYRAMMRGERVAIPRWRDKLMVQSERLAPRRLVAMLARKAQENR
jgi:short-subunit dehydrogenase